MQQCGRDPAATADPPHNCALCPRLSAFISGQRVREPSWHNGPVPSFGAPSAELLIVGLAPGLKGANRTGRPFTGDYAGDLLYSSLIEFSLAEGVFQARPDDGLVLSRTMITNAVRCVPPENKPTPVEIATCRRFLVERIATLPQLRIILALGRVAHESTLTALGARKSAHQFAHGARHEIIGNSHPTLVLFDSYHCSRYNTNTGRLTTPMFHAVFRQIALELNGL